MLSRMTLLRRADGSLLVHSPVVLDQVLRGQIDELGEVSAVVAPNLWHHLFFEDFVACYPAASACVAPGLGEKIPGLAAYPSIDAVDWLPDFDVHMVQGLPILNESAWFHRATGTLVLTDMLFCFGPENTWFTRLFARAQGMYQKLGFSRSMKLTIQDRAALAESVRVVAHWDIQRIVLAHDQLIESDAREQFLKAFSWLPGHPD